jgi:hypothetical protein
MHDSEVIFINWCLEPLRKNGFVNRRTGIQLLSSSLSLLCPNFRYTSQLHYLNSARSIWAKMARRAIAASPHARLPPELWRTIFAFVNADAWLGNSELLVEKFKRIELIRNIALTCRCFRWLAQPLLCKTLQVKPFTTGRSGSYRGRRIALRDDIADDSIQRLTFFASEWIAPYVRNIFVNSATYRGVPHADDCDAVLRFLVHHLHHFVGLRRLVFADGLGLRFDDFVLPPYASPPSIPLTDYVGPRVLLPLLAKEPTLRNVRLISLEESGFDEPAHLMPALSSGNITSQVASLEIRIEYLTEDTFRTIFSIFTRLTNLQMFVREPFFVGASAVSVGWQTMKQRLTLNKTALFHV